MFERTITKYLPQEFVASQEIMVHYEGKDYEMWSGVKGSPRENTESRSKELIVNCELNSEKNHVWVNGSPYSTRCIWNTESDKEISWEKEEVFDNSLEKANRITKE